MAHKGTGDCEVKVRLLWAIFDALTPRIGPPDNYWAPAGIFPNCTPTQTVILFIPSLALWRYVLWRSLPLDFLIIFELFFWGVGLEQGLCYWKQKLKW